MAPPSVRKAKRPADDPVSQRVKHLYSAAKSYETSLPILAAYLGRQTLKIANDVPKALSRDCLQSLCPKCGYPWESPDKESFTLKPLTSGRRRNRCTSGRPGSAKPNAVRVSSCRLCGRTKSIRVHVDKLQVGKDVDAGLSAERPAGADSDGGRSPEPSPAELPGSGNGAVPGRSQNAEHNLALGTTDEGPHAPAAGDNGQSEIDCQAASTEPDASQGNAPLTDILAPSLPGAHDNPSRADEQPRLSENWTEPFGMHQQKHAADRTAHLEGLNETGPATAEAAPVSGPEACAVECENPAGAAHDELPRMESKANGSGIGEDEAEGAQGDIRSQVRHMMDASLPIASAMQEAVKQFESSEDGTSTLIKWPHNGRKRKRKSDAQRYRWLRAGRTWRKRAK